MPTACPDRGSPDGPHVPRRLLKTRDVLRLLQISRPTVRQAMSYLMSQGLIMREKGRGTFVAPPKLEHDVSHAFEETENYLRVFEYLESSHNFFYRNCSNPDLAVSEREAMREDAAPQVCGELAFDVARQPAALGVGVAQLGE